MSRFLGFRLADLFYDAAASSDYSCTFRGVSGAAVFVDGNDELLDESWTYRALRIAGWSSWVVGIAVGVGISAPSDCSDAIDFGAAPPARGRGVAGSCS